ncbi:uncharacterized protein [Panulirus ornatus]|uniref:uncharacterized protein isoform X3 n=1 Tax=Panulirus ornatus TaxID=150431 RepID=UPI003A895884
MFYSGPDEDDDEDFTPTSTTSSKLSTLFGGKPDNKSSSLKYVPPKQPRPDQTNSSGSSGAKSSAPSPSKQQITAPATQSTAVLIAAPVHAFLYVNGVAQSQGRVMCCILGNYAEKNFQVIMYRSKQDHLTRTRIHQHFTFTVLPKNYGNFTDDQQRNWSVMFEAAQYGDFVTQMGVCCALVRSSAGSSVPFTQDVTVGEGPALKEGDQAQISLSTWNITDGKKGDQIEEMKTGHRIKLRDVTGNWMAGLVGAQKNTRRLIFTQDGSAPKIYDITVERVKQKGGDQSGRNTPQVDTQQGLREGSSDGSETLDSSTKDVAGNLKEVTGPTVKASLVSRMARVGHPLLPCRPLDNHTLPTDSESEVEEISRRKNLRHNSGSVEELAATPAIRSRASSARSDSQRPEPAPRPPHLSSHTQPLVVYQSSWQQPGILPAGYSTAASGPSGPHGVVSQQLPPASDPTLPLLFSETRSQNTELKIIVSKISDKIDSLMNKIETKEQQQQYGGTFGHSGVVPLRMMHPHQEQYFHNSVVSADPHGLLTQITSIVNENDEMKTKLDDKEKKIISLNDSVTQLLQKNQKLLEEKTDMLVARQQTQEASTSVSLSEVLSLREEKAKITAELSTAQHQLNVLKNELCQSKESLETQHREIHSLKTEMHVQQTARQEADASSQKHLSPEKERLEESLQTLQTERDNLKHLLDTSEQGKEGLRKDLTVMSSKKTVLEEQLQVALTECERLKSQAEATETKLESLTQQVLEEKELNNKKGSDIKQFDGEQEKALVMQSSIVKELQEEVLQLRTRCSEMEEERDHTRNRSELQLQKLAAEKTILEETVQKLKKAASSHSNATPEEIIGTVKKVMNTMFRSLKSQFLDEGTYSGSDVKQTLLNVIRDTTLQVLEELERKSAVAESSSLSQDKKDNQTAVTSIIKDKATESNRENLNEVSCEVESTRIGMTKPCIDNEKPEKMADTREENSIVENEEKSSHWEDTGEENTLCKSEVSEQTVGKDSFYDKESRTDGIPFMCQSTDFSLVNHALQISYTSCDCSNISDNHKLIPTYCLGKGQKNEAFKVIQVKGNKEETVKSVEDKKPRVPVVDIENTEVRMITSENFDSSRDSSLERVLSPQPCQPPLFSDEDDEDWLSVI